MDIAKSRQRIDGWFPRLAGFGYDPKSEETAEYNCIAWAVGETHRRWDAAPGYYWPPGLPRDDQIETLVRVFKSSGYELCDELNSEFASLEAGVLKIVLYADGSEWTHAVRQLPTGRWTSKLGDYEDIEHDTLDGFEEHYGQPRFLMRMRTTEQI
ncbi:MAG TPA: hypothetical protein VFC46_12310 [Humisphaera sp.]|nr:hypothetical protein [Humisphaera sp.]